MNVRAHASALSLLTGLLLVTGCGGGSPGSSTFTASLTLSPISLTFPATPVGVAAPSQSATLTNTGTATLSITGTPLSGPGFSQTNNCPLTFPPGATCTVTVNYTPTAPGVQSGSITFNNLGVVLTTLPLTGTGTAATTYTATLSPASLTFPATTVGLTSAPQTLTLTNTGTGILTVAAALITVPAPIPYNVAFSNCSPTLAPGTSCTLTVTYSPSASGTNPATLAILFTGPGSTTPASIPLSGTAIATATAANTIDCSVANLNCPDSFSGLYTNAGAPLPSDPIAPGNFHGYADASIRKDPNSSAVYMAYSWPHTLADGTRVVDLHLASSANNGVSFTEVGPLYQSFVSTQTTSTAYSPVNDSSTETIDLLPIPLTGASAGQTLWVQSHQSYLVKPTGGTFGQLDPTAFISITAVQLATPAASGAGTALLALSSPATPEARLGGSSTDPNRNVTQNVAALASASAKCAHWGQAALWYQTPLLYVTLECSELVGGGNIDANELAHFTYTTTPAGSDASKWVWSYLGEFGTAAEAAKLGALPSEGVAYQFFTEPVFALSKTGRLLVIMSPSVFSPAGSTQPVIQYGCRAFPVSFNLNSVTLATDSTTGAPSVLAKVVESDIYAGANEGPGACTYDPSTANGIILERKFEADPIFGFYIYPVNSGILP